MKRILMLILAAVMICSLAACGEDAPAVVIPTEPEESKETTADRGDAVILFTGGLQGAYGRDETRGAVGYAALKAYIRDLKKDDAHVILIDGGDSADPEGAKEFWEIVDACAYDLRVPGAMELSSGMDALTDRGKDLKNCTYISCNLMDATRNTTVFDPYVLVEAGDVTLGFVGVTRPQTLEDGYAVVGLNDGQLLRDTVQQAIDDAADAGADFVIVVGNLGTAPEDSPCTTAEVIAGITGLAAWLDCGSGAVLDGDTGADKDDFEIPLCAPGSDFAYVGQIRVDLDDGSAAVELLTELEEEDRTILGLIGELEDGE